MRCKAGFFSGLTPAAALLLHCDGVDGSPTFTDSSRVPVSVTNSGLNAYISETHSKFGGTSGRFDANGHLSVSTHPRLDLRSGDFTVDFWMRVDDVDVDQGVAGQAEADAGTWAIYVEGSGLKALFADDDPVCELIGTIASATWHHVALTRQGNTLRLFVDGVLADSDTLAGDAYQAQSPTTVGDAFTGAGTKFAGYIDEFRIVSGSALFVDAFTPPTAAYA